ncbi:MAG: electron transfer flavoprotein subunit beta/FixA family protein [Chloroflexi bacterium]|nr:electron transfer flavoprotein subunit beta/FixA family protein [Chloroflexota bacterium]
MNIIVTVKQVPDPDIPPSHFKVDESARKVVPPAGVAPVMNGYDANALEASLRLKEKLGGRVTVVTLGPQEARDTLKRAIAMGADAAVHINDPTLLDGDSALTARVLAGAIEKIGGFDLILSGRQASDTDAGQVPLGIAEMLGLPAVSPVVSIEAANGGVRVHRMVEDGYQVIDAPLPAVLSVSSEIGEPRYPPLRGIMAAGRAQIPVWTAADLGLTDGSVRKATLQRLFVEQRDARVELIEADSPEAAGVALADKLREAKLI